MPIALAPLPCTVCGRHSLPLDVVDFNKSGVESRGKYLPLSGIPVYYYLCEACGFCFAPEFKRWSQRDFVERIYNGGYADVDPDYAGPRPRQNAQFIEELFGGARQKIRHIDYGSGAGLLSRILSAHGWESSSYDPFGDQAAIPAGAFELVTAFEVFEHVADVSLLVHDLVELMAPESLLLLSTLVSDGEIAPNQRLTWWYAAPRNGHISLFSSKSLALALGSVGLSLSSFSAGMHLGFRRLPQWASHLRISAVLQLPASN